MLRQVKARMLGVILNMVAPNPDITEGASYRYVRPPESSGGRNAGSLHVERYSVGIPPRATWWCGPRAMTPQAMTSDA